MKAVLLTVMIALTSLAQEPGNAERRFDVAVPPTTDVDSMAISPDGQKFVFVAAFEGRQRLWIHDLKSDSSRPLKGTEDVSLPFPFWSPDSRSVGFFKGIDIRRIDIETEAQQVVATWGGGRGGTWNKDHTILFATAQGSILQVSDSGGPVSPVTQPEKPLQSQHLFPSFLPDGRHFLYYVVGTADVSGVYVGNIDGSRGKRLVSADAAAVYATSGQILFGRQGKLIAQDFDPETLKLSGNPFQIAEKTSVSVARAAGISTSSSGQVAYRSGTAQRQFTWFDRSGKYLGTVGGPTSVIGAAMSRDGNRVAFGRTVDGNPDIWFLDLFSGAFSRITTSPATENSPVWSLDDRRLAFISNRNVGYELYEKRAPFEGPESLLLPVSTGRSMTTLDWSPDGRFLLVRSGQYDIVAVQIDNFALVPVSTSTANSTINHPQFSPDGKWLAFSSNRSGRVEIHIAPFLPGSALQPSGPVSISGGAWPRWAKDGKELFYVAPDGMLMAVPFDSSTGQTKPPTLLFVPPMFSSVESQYSQQYLVADDGRFLVIAAEEVRAPIHVISNLQHKN
jgi:Tol biopolymer transport system component